MKVKRWKKCRRKKSYKNSWLLKVATSKKKKLRSWRTSRCPRMISDDSFEPPSWRIRKIEKTNARVKLSQSWRRLSIIIICFSRGSHWYAINWIKAGKNTRYTKRAGLISIGRSRDGNFYIQANTKDNYWQIDLIAKTLATHLGSNPCLSKERKVYCSRCKWCIQCKARLRKGEKMNLHTLLSQIFRKWSLILWLWTDNGRTVIVTPRKTVLTSGYLKIWLQT